MKKFLFFLLSLVVSVNSFAQWKEIKIEADELKDQVECTQYRYDSDDGIFVYWSNYPEYLCIFSTKEIFTSNRSQETLFTIGIYDNENNLLEKYNIYMARGKNGEYNRVNWSTLSIDGNWEFGGSKYKTKVYNAIMNHLNNNKGYVRFLANLYNGASFDLKVPCKNNQ